MRSQGGPRGPRHCTQRRRYLFFFLRSRENSLVFFLWEWWGVGASFGGGAMGTRPSSAAFSSISAQGPLRNDLPSTCPPPPPPLVWPFNLSDLPTLPSAHPCPLPVLSLPPSASSPGFSPILSLLLMPLPSPLSLLASHPRTCSPSPPPISSCLSPRSSCLSSAKSVVANQSWKATGCQGGPQMGYLSEEYRPAPVHPAWAPQSFHLGKVFLK